MFNDLTGARMTQILWSCRVRLGGPVVLSSRISLKVYHQAIAYVKSCRTSGNAGGRASARSALVFPKLVLAATWV